MLATLRRRRPALPFSPGSPDGVARPRAARRARAAGIAVAAAALLGPVLGGSAAVAADGAGPSGPCADDAGVTVVVDATELGGDVTVGCAPDPATGTEALAQAGFAEARDPSGFICAIGGLPDPCPTEFTGSFWSYWYASPDEEWTSYAEGSDTATPEAGAVEGWRYGDGSQAPDAVPADIAPGTGSAPADRTDDGAEPGTDAADDAPDLDAGTAAADPEGGTSLLDDVPEAWRPVVAVAAGLAGVGMVILVVVVLRRLSRDRGTD